MKANVFVAGKVGQMSTPRREVGKVIPHRIWPLENRLLSVFVNQNGPEQVNLDRRSLH